MRSVGICASKMCHLPLNTDRLEKLTGELSQRSSITSEEDYKIAIKEREIAIARLTAQGMPLPAFKKS